MTRPIARPHTAFAALVTWALVLIGSAKFSSVGASESAAEQPASAASTQDAEIDRRIEERCPGALRHQEDSRTAALQAPVKAPNQPKTRATLIAMTKVDQEARSEAINTLTPESERKVSTVDQANLQSLKRIIDRQGYPTRAMIGDDGMEALWLLVQHADDDTAFQQRVLAHYSMPTQKGQFAPWDFAMLTDRVLIHQSKPQRYATQFGERDGKMQPGPIEDPDHIDERRASVGLGPLAEYACVIEAVYGHSAPK